MEAAINLGLQRTAPVWNPTLTSRDRSARNMVKACQDAVLAQDMVFKHVTHSDMDKIIPYLMMEEGRTTDFSYAGVLMWVDYFKYEYAIVRDTLFIKGVVEDDTSKPAFSLPIGKMSLADSLSAIKAYCRANGIKPELSAVPEYAVDRMRGLDVKKIEELNDWGDYLYDAHTLATLSGKKMGKKRNHVNKFDSLYPDWQIVDLTSANVNEAIGFMHEVDIEGDFTPMAIEERAMTRKLLDFIKEGDNQLIGAILYVGNEVAAFTIGDIKRDTLFVHVEKATRKFEGSYEKINKEFAKMICDRYPAVSFINREDDSGDPGLRHAKQSYHPVEVLKKYNVIL